MIIATCLWDNKTKSFPNVHLASIYIGISFKRIEWCIRTGNKWKGWVFDEGIL